MPRQQILFALSMALMAGGGCQLPQPNPQPLPQFFIAQENPESKHEQKTKHHE